MRHGRRQGQLDSARETIRAAETKTSEKVSEAESRHAQELLALQKLHEVSESRRMAAEAEAESLSQRLEDKELTLAGLQLEANMRPPEIGVGPSEKVRLPRSFLSANSVAGRKTYRQQS